MSDTGIQNPLIVFITGGSGFIGSALIRHLITHTQHIVVNLDKLTYAANPKALDCICHSERYHFVQGDINNAALVTRLFNQFQPDVVMHLAAESHVDRSITGPSDFIQTNIVGTYTLLEASRQYYSTLSTIKASQFKFHHISTDEVFGDLSTNALFTENSAYKPSSPYSASKASADHLVRAWQRTYNLPCIISHCSNNYGPFQHAEKLIPLTISNALNSKAIPIYGNGKQIRDWLYVDDHVLGLLNVMLHGTIGESYNIGGHNEQQNIDVVHAICVLLEEFLPSHHQSKTQGKGFAQLIHFVEDRAGHDVRYAVDASKIKAQLNWQPLDTFATGLRKTVQWYLEQQC